MQIASALDELNDGSDISGASDDSDMDETWMPAGSRDMADGDAEETTDEELGGECDGGGDRSDQELPDLDGSVAPRPSTSSAQPPKKRGRKERRVWEWEKRDLPPQEKVTSKVRPKNLENCHLDVQFFMEMFGQDNIELITLQTNIMRTKIEIERNRPMPPVTEKELRQWIGIHLYMSVVNLPATQLHWNRRLRNETVAGAMTRDRFNEISSFFHLSDNDLQVERGAPGYDRLFKVRQFLTNLSAHYEDLAEFEKVCTCTITVLYLARYSFL